MMGPSYNATNTSLDDILKELESRFGAADQQTPHASNAKKRNSSSPKLLFGAFALFLSLGGAIMGTQLAEQQTAQQLAAAPIVQQGTVQGATTDPQIGYPIFDLDVITTPIDVSEYAVENPNGFRCEHSDCTLGNTDWAWLNEEGDQVPVICTPTQEGWRFYCPYGPNADGVCTQNPTNIGTFSAGQYVDLEDYVLPNRAGTYQFNFNDPETIPTSGSCGAVTVTKSAPWVAPVTPVTTE